MTSHKAGTSENYQLREEIEITSTPGVPSYVLPNHYPPSQSNDYIDS